MKALLLLLTVTTLTMVGCVAGPYESSYRYSGSSYGGSNYYQPAYQQPCQPVYQTFEPAYVYNPPTYGAYQTPYGVYQTAYPSACRSYQQNNWRNTGQTSYNRHDNARHYQH